MDATRACRSVPRARPAAPVDAGRLLAADPRGLRAAGLLVGASVPGVVATAAWWFGTLADPGGYFVTWVAAAGVPIGALIGALMAERVVRPGWPATVVVAALAAPLVAVLGGAVIAAATTPGWQERVVQPDLATGLAGILAGLGVFGFFSELLGVPVTLPVGIVVAVLVRRLGSMPRGRALALAVGFALATAAVGLLTARAAGLPEWLSSRLPL